MASTSAAVRRVVLLFLLVLALYSAMAESRPAPIDLCGLLNEHNIPGRDCNTIRCFRYYPVCGVNGVTYGCGCAEANCYGVRVMKLAAC